MGQIAVARCSDALVIAELHAATVSVAYREFFPDSPPPTVASLAEIWASRLTAPTAVALVATRDGRPVGSVLTRADPDFPEGQLAGLHVLTTEWGQGIGGTLHDAAVAELTAVGYPAAGLWVIAANRRARRMYERRAGCCGRGSSRRTTVPQRSGTGCLFRRRRCGTG